MLEKRPKKRIRVRVKDDAPLGFDHEHYWGGCGPPRESYSRAPCFLNDMFCLPFLVASLSVSKSPKSAQEMS